MNQAVRKVMRMPEMARAERQRVPPWVAPAADSQAQTTFDRALHSRWAELWLAVTPVWAVLALSRVLFYALERLRHPDIVPPASIDALQSALQWPLVVAGCYLIVAAWRRGGLRWAGGIAIATAIAIGTLARPTYIFAGLLLSGDLFGLRGLDVLRSLLPASWSAWAGTGIEYGVLYLSCAAAAVGFLSFRQLMNERLLRTRVESAAAQERLRTLRAQLNPHFFFNTLNSLTSVTETQSPAAGQLIRRVSDLFRRTLDASEVEQHELTEELAYVETYLRIQQVRHPLRIDWVFHCDVERADVILVPTLILQPLVENAVTHGLRGGTHVVRIEIEAGVVRESLVLCVRNTFRESVPSGVVRRSGVGLRNVRERLCMLFGERAALETSRPSPDRFLARVILPLAERPAAAVCPMEQECGS